jgi:hypothetical protein
MKPPPPMRFATRVRSSANDPQCKVDRGDRIGLQLESETIANHHYAIKSKLGVHSDIELVYFYMRQRLVAPVTG